MGQGENGTGQSDWRACGRLFSSYIIQAWQVKIEGLFPWGRMMHEDDDDGDDEDEEEDDDEEQEDGDDDDDEEEEDDDNNTI